MTNQQIEKSLREMAGMVFFQKPEDTILLLAAADIIADYDKVCGFLADATDSGVEKLKTERDELRAQTANAYSIADYLAAALTGEYPAQNALEKYCDTLANKHDVENVMVKFKSQKIKY